jgi:hypothetical protein
LKPNFELNNRNSVLVALALSSPMPQLDPLENPKQVAKQSIHKYVRFWITYIYQEKNACADNLAKYMRFWITYIYSASQTQLCCSIKTLQITQPQKQSF